MIPRTLTLTACMAGILALPAAALAHSVSTTDFVHKASMANEFEIETSKMALEKSHNDNVKSFAQQMVDDHSKTGDKMKEALRSSKTDAKPMMNMDEKHQQLLEKLGSMSGSNFDRQYISIQKDAHKEAVSLFSTYSSSGKDPALKDFASDTLPTLKEHLAHVKQLSSKE